MDSDQCRRRAVVPARQILFWRGLQHANCARDEKDDDSQGDADLDHGQNLGPSGQQRRISRTKGRALRKRNKKVIDKMRPPSAAFESTALGFLDLHLWKDETAAAEFAPLLAKRWPAAVQPPVPNREDEDVG